MKCTTWIAVVSVVGTAILSQSAVAAPLFKVTEVYTGVQGFDGTPDWFELTNFGDMSGNIGGFYYDDDSETPNNNYQLPNFDVDPCESVIVLIEALDLPDTPDVDEAAVNIANFYSFWGLTAADVQVGVTDGGSLGAGGDEANVYSGNFPLSPLVDALDYRNTAFGNQPHTIEDATGTGPLALSQMGLHGGFASAGLAGDANVQLIGSPGINTANCVPEPGSMLMLVLGVVGVLFAGRRR